MKTFLVDLHGGLARLGPALPLLYPYQAEGALELLPHHAGRPLGELADAVRISVLRDYRPGLQLLVVVDLERGGLVRQAAAIREGLVAPLEQAGLHPARVTLVAVDALARDPITGLPDPAFRECFLADVAALNAYDTVHAGAAAPGAALKNGRAEHDPVRPLEGMLVLRYALQRVPEPVFQQHLVRLVYLLAALVELADDPQVRQERLYAVDEVALDPARVRAWLGDYQECLTQVLRGVAHQVEHPEPVAVRLIENAGCGCQRVLDVLGLQGPRFGWLRRRDDFGRWRAWWQQTGRSLEGHAAAGDDLLRRCTREWRARDFPEVERSVEHPADLAADLGERLRAARRALARESPPRPPDPDWAGEMEALTPAVHARIESRPSAPGVALSAAALGPMLLAPAVLALPAGPAAMAATAALLAGAAAVVAAGALWTLGRRLDDQTHRALERAQEASSRTSDQVDRRKRQLAALCEVEVARRNAAAADEAQQRSAAAARMLKYHRRELERHQARALAFLKHHDTAPPARAPHPREADEPAPLPEALVPALPPEQNRVYAPALCTAAPGEQAYEIHIRAGAMVIRRRSARLYGLQHVQLGDDIIYRPAPLLGPPSTAPAGAGGRARPAAPRHG